MLLSPDTDFHCETAAGVFVCYGRTDAARSVFDRLRATVYAALSQINASRQLPPPPPFPPTFGPTLATGIQTVVANLNRAVPVPDVLKPAFSVQASEQQLIRNLAQRAPLVLDYIQRVVTLYPHVLLAPPVGLPPIGGALPVGKIAAAGAALAALGGLAFLGSRVQQRISGKVDGTAFLGPGDDDDGDIGAGGEDGQGASPADAEE